jgi:sortase (surface protein transpeptidase)
MSKRFLRFLGGAMALAGAAILAFALYSYVSQRQLEAELTAKIPGQNQTVGSPDNSIVLAPATAMPTLDESQLSPSVTPLPTHNPPVQPDPTTAAELARTPTPTLVAHTPIPTKQATKALTATPVLVRANAATTTPTNGSSANSVPRGMGAVALRLIIPKLNMNLPIKPADYVTYQQNGQAVSDWNVPFAAAGHLITTVQPGEVGNAVLSGHHNLTAPNTFGLGAFAGLWNLSAGDQLQVTTEDGKQQLWSITESFPIKEGGEPLAVRIQHAQQIMADTPDPTLTLVTCWNGKSNPLSGNTYRWIVHAKLVNVN